MKYGKQVKEQAVLRILNGDTTITKMSEELGVHYTTVRDWVRQYRKKKGESFPGSGHPSPSEAEMMRILKENIDLKEENEFLKKPRPSLQKARNEVSDDTEKQLPFHGVKDVPNHGCKQERLLCE